MSSKADVVAIERRALACPHGWRRLPGVSSSGHPVLALPSGRRVQVSYSPGDVNSARNLAKQLADACGCESFWGRAGVGRRSRKTFGHTDFDPSKAAREQERFHTANPERESLPRQYADIGAELQASDPRRSRERCQELAAELVRLAAEMDRLHIYYEPLGGVDPLMTLPQIAAYAGDRSTDWVRRHTRLSDDNPLALHTVNIGGRICARRSEVNAWLDRLAA